MYLIVGASGFLGHYMINSVLENTEEKILALYNSNLISIQNERVKPLKFNAENPEDIKKLNDFADDNAKVVYLTSYSSQDFCDKNPDISRRLNVEALRNFLDTFKKINLFYYASTDCVYGESKDGAPFREDEGCNPINEYGRQKVEAEQIVKEKGYNIIRLPLMMGPSLQKNKEHFFDKICHDLSFGKKLEMYKDSFRSTLSFKQCADFWVKVTENESARAEKILNFASDKPISKYELALKIAQKKSYDTKNIIPVSINDPNNVFFSAKRAGSTVMDNAKLKTVLNLDKIELEIL